VAKFVKESKVDQTLGDAVAAHSTGNTPTTAGVVASKTAGAELCGIRKVKIKVNSFKHNIASDADLAFGQKIHSFPQGAVIPVAAKFELTLTAPDGLGMAVASDDGEMALGSVIASGAVDELGGTATFEDLLAAPIALTALTKSGIDINTENHIVKGSLAVYDGTATPLDVFLNIAGTWDQTAAENVTVDGYVTLFYIWLGDD
jgi:hypothetical protein